MQGKKPYEEKLFTTFRLSEHIPDDNFYRRLRSALDLRFLYKETRAFYGRTGNPGLDPVVFAKLCLVGYLENIGSDRRLMQHCLMRLDILYFLGYDLDEPLPWHSTLSRTRQLFGEEVFEAIFNRVLLLCVSSGLVSGHTQAVDSAPVKANASMDSLELRMAACTLEEHLDNVRRLNQEEQEDAGPSRKARQNKADDYQKTRQACDREIKEIARRQEKWSSDQKNRPGGSSEGSQYTSNKTHYSPVDPDARISTKPGKPRKLNYAAQMAVDTSHHVITDIAADFADKKDNQSLPQIVERLEERLSGMGLKWETILADTGYSSGENYALLEDKNIASYIPPHGTYKGGPEGFVYHKEEDYWLCRNDKKVTFRKILEAKSRTPYGRGILLKKQYFTRRSDCKGCPFKTACIGKSHERRIEITYYNEQYERAIDRVNSRSGRQMKKLRQSTVEPVFGILTQFMALQKVWTRGIGLANKQMLMAATAYNLKKYLKFTTRKPQVMAMSLKKALNQLENAFKDVLSALVGLRGWGYGKM